MPSTLKRGYEDDASLTYANNSFDAENFLFALRLHYSLVKATGEVDRGVRRARFLGVLRGQNRPAVLIEGGYLSNPREARRIADPVFREKLAETLASVLAETPIIKSGNKEVKTQESRTSAPTQMSELHTNKIALP
jgi:hypothetical protein